MMRSNLWSRIFPQDSTREISLHIPPRVKEAVLVLPMGLALGILLSWVLTAMTTPSVVVLVAVELFVDWYLNLTLTVPTLALWLWLVFFLERPHQYPYAAQRAL